MGNNASKSSAKAAERVHNIAEDTRGQGDDIGPTSSSERPSSQALRGRAPAGKSAAVEASQQQEQQKHKQHQQQQQQRQQHQHQQQQQQQRSRQQSIWSLGSLSGGGRFHWSFTGASGRSSSYDRNATIGTRKKSFNSLQGRRLKTIWHRPLTNAIFNSHFKETTRNEQLYVDRLIAKGAFGAVYRVIEKDNANRSRSINECCEPLVYALKVLRKSKIICENSVQQIKDEADIQKLCGHHPFIVRQIDLWQNRRNLHILSEYVPNGELFAKVTKFTIDLIRLYMAEIALAIDFLHNAGIIYRDAKPENIMLTDTYHIKLTDFGLSKWLRLGSATRTMCGTFQYMAPEILRGEPYGHAVDWWALGVIACQMFTERSPNIEHFVDVPALTKAIFDVRRVSDVSVTNASANEKGQEDEEEDICPESLIAATQLHIGNNYLPVEVEGLSHEAKDVVKRLLEIDPKRRIRSVLALQKIALYKNYKIDAKHLRRISPLDLISQSDPGILNKFSRTEDVCKLAMAAFHDF